MKDEARQRGDGTLEPGRYSPGFARAFAWWVERRVLARRFHAVRLARENAGVLGELAGHPGPVIVVMNHPSWWDPLAAVLLARRFMSTREHMAPIDTEMLRTFGFFRRLGLFGIDPDDPASLEAMAGYVGERLRERPRTTLWVTPQGRLADVRSEIEIRPGAAVIAARHGDVRAASAALEYVFWGDPKPELLIRLERCEPAEGRRTTAGWHRAMLEAMRRNAAALARLAIARDEGAFVPLVGGDRARINPLYDLWLRARGKGPTIDARRRQLDQERRTESGRERAQGATP